MTAPYDLFFAVSYKGACTDDTYRHQLEAAAEAAISKAIRIYVAPILEVWGNERPPRVLGIGRDLAALRQARGLILFLGGHYADGALVEVGVALGWAKPLWFVRNSSNDDLGYLQ